MHGDVDLARRERSLDLARENSFAAGPWIDRLKAAFVSARLDHLNPHVEFRPRSSQRIYHHRRLRARQLAAARAQKVPLLFGAHRAPLQF